MFRILTASVLFLSSVLHAQESLVSVRAMSLDRAGFPETFLRTKDGYAAVDFSEVQPSMPYLVHAEGILPIFFAMPSADDKEKPKPDVLVKLPPAKGGILLLGWESGETRNFVALPDNLDNGGKDNWLLVNATGDRLGFQLGKGTNPTVVEPGKSVIHRVTVPFGEGAAVTAARMDGEATKTIFSTYWTVYDEQRCVILFVKDGERIRVRQILDVTSVGKAEEE